MFEIAPLNPLSFIQPGKESIFRKSALEFINGYQEKVCYFQKWQTNDKTRIQVLTNYDFYLEVVALDSDLPVLELLPEIMPTLVVSENFQVKEVEIDFSLLEEGVYFSRIIYNGDEGITGEVISEPFEVREKHENTLLFKYANSENNFSVIFANDLEFSLRVEGVIADFTPEADDVIYNDIARNSTLLDSIPYLSFILYVGNEYGIPAYMADKINRVMSCDILQIDGDHYAKKEGAAWDTKRADEYPFVGLSLEIMPVENRFTKQYRTGNDADLNDIVPMQKIKNFENVDGNLTISGVFRAKTLLEKIAIIKTGLNFEYRVGTTEGGDEIGTFQVLDVADTQTIEHLFTGPATLYISGLSSVDFISIIYKQLDEKPINPSDFGGNGNTGSGSLNIGGTVIYSTNDEAKFNEDFDIAAGLGRENTPWFGYAICDGRNNTVDMGGLFPVGYKPGEYEINATGGDKEVALTKAQMPKHDHDYTNMLGTDSRRGNVGSPFLKFPGPNGVPPEKTGEAGNNEAHENRPPFRAVVYVTRIF